MFIIIDRWTAAATGEPGYDFDHRWVDLDQIATAAQVAVIAAEDQRFSDHNGFDLVEIGQVVSASLAGKSRRGASTISQQTAKNLFLWSGRSWLRKGLEAWLTICIETLWTKRRILEIYLNFAEFGRGVFGIEAACWRYFKRSASEITVPQAARLAAVLPNPLQYRADSPDAHVLRRQRWIEGQMRGIGGAAYLARLD